MRVLMPVLHYYPVIGGLETWTRNIAERLANKAEIFVVTAMVGDQPKYEVKNDVKIFRTSLFNLTDLSYSSPIFILGAMPFIFFKSLSLTKKEKINLLHCQGFLSAFMGYLVLKFCGIPYIVTVQSLQSKNWLKKRVYKKAVGCIAASSAIKKYFDEIGCRNVEVIPNGIDSERFQGLERKPHQGFVVMTIARLEKVKGIDYLIRAFARLGLPERPSLIIVGDGSERKNLENLVKHFNIEDKVKFVGQIPPKEIPEYLAMADCFVLPSLREGFGIAILEAMAAGVPVIASRVGGILDIIEDGRTGLLVEPGNSEAIAKAIYEIYSGRKFYKIDLEKYNWQNIAEKVFKIYENLISRRNLSA